LEARRKTQDDCIGCHMPKAPVRDTEHAVFTDHSIPRRIPRASGQETGERTLTSFWKSPVDDRDLGLAFATLAGDDAAMRRRALELLRQAESRNPDDLLVLVQLAQLYDQAGDDDKAMALSERALRLDPSQVTVMVNLGAYYMQRGRAQEAKRLWADAITRAPGLTTARVNLAVAQYRAGDTAAAEATIVKALEYDPDHETARRLLSEIRAGR
jgi:Flp pilus assembly protein TadD